MMPDNAEIPPVTQEKVNGPHHRLDTNQEPHGTTPENRPQVANTTYQRGNTIQKEEEEESVDPDEQMVFTAYQFLEQVDNLKRLVSPVLEKLLFRPSNVTTAKSTYGRGYLGFLDDGIPVRNRIVADNSQNDGDVEFETLIEISTHYVTTTATEVVLEVKSETAVSTEFVTEIIADVVTASPERVIVTTTAEPVVVTATAEPFIATVGTETIVSTTTLTQEHTATQIRTEYQPTTTTVSLLDNVGVVETVLFVEQRPAESCPWSSMPMQTTFRTVTEPGSVTTATVAVEIPVEIEVPIEMPCSVPAGVLDTETVSETHTVSVTAVTTKFQVIPTTTTHTAYELVRAGTTATAPSRKLPTLSGPPENPIPIKSVQASKGNSSRSDQGPQYTDMLLEIETVYMNANIGISLRPTLYIFALGLALLVIV